jgi:16S rRNA (cytosine967-C5)-methyltransferase
MTPGARLQAVLDILDAFEQSYQAPLDQFLSFYLKKRRYIGSKDRAFISETVYQLFRYWGKIRAIAMMQGVVLEGLHPEKRNRFRLLIFLIHATKASHAEIACWFNGQHHHPLPLASDEKRLFKEAIAVESLPLWAQAEVPPDLLGIFQETFGEQTLIHGKALQTEAPVDLRVNTLKTSLEQLQACLALEGIPTHPTPLSPLGLRLHKRQSLSHLEAFQQGLFEIQDEGSQLIALLTDARPGEKVVDFCAGAGGKSLALSALMSGKGRIWACDVAEWRLQRAQVRLRRADVQNVTLQLLMQPVGQPVMVSTDPWVEAHAGKMDRVLVDAPCSGVGTWRRQPEKKWRLRLEDLKRLFEVQQQILQNASQLVRPGGELLYATCSLFSKENEHQIARFLKNNPDFVKVPMEARWAKQLPEKTPPVWVEGCLRLTPLEHQTDGFFMAILKRVS